MIRCGVKCMANDAHTQKIYIFHERREEKVRAREKSWSEEWKLKTFCHISLKSER